MKNNVVSMRVLFVCLKLRGSTIVNAKPTQLPQVIKGEQLPHLFSSLF